MTTWPIRIGVAWTVFGGTWADRKRMPDPFKTIDESVELVVTSQRKFSHLGPATAVREPDHDLASKCALDIRYPSPPNDLDPVYPRYYRTSHQQRVVIHHKTPVESPLD
jgi:hypothetical protein